MYIFTSTIDGIARSHTSTSSVGMLADSPLGVEALEHVFFQETRALGGCLTLLLFKNWTFLSITNFGWCFLRSLSSWTHAHKWEKQQIFSKTLSSYVFLCLRKGWMLKFKTPLCFFQSGKSYAKQLLLAKSQPRGWCHMLFTYRLLPKPETSKSVL